MLIPTRTPNPISAALEQAMASPRVQQAVAVFVNALVDEGEAILRARHAGETLRIYTPKRGGRSAKEERDRRIQARAAGGTHPAHIAADERMSLRQVQRVIARAERARHLLPANVARAEGQ